MSEFTPFFKTAGDELPSCAIFMSGKGTNAEKIINSVQQDPSPLYQVKVIVTDRPKSSRAIEIGEAYSIPVISLGLKSFYQENGLSSTSIATPEGLKVRQLWTKRIIRELENYQIDFGVLAGFEPLCNIMEQFPCLNIHPGDLTDLKDGKRFLTGLHTIPVEKAILSEYESLRSSVILAEPFCPDSDNVDNGHILGISEEVKIDLMGHSIEELEACKFSRPALKPKEGFNDSLEKVSKHNLQKLKENGDWQLFPKVINEFAANKFCHDSTNQLFYKIPAPIPITTVLFGTDFKEIIFSLN